MNIKSDDKEEEREEIEPHFGNELPITELGNEIPQSNIVVIVGHNNKNLEQTLRDNKDKFKDKYIIGIYCSGTQGTLFNFVEQTGAIGQTTFESQESNTVPERVAGKIIAMLKKVIKENR